MTKLEKLTGFAVVFDRFELRMIEISCAGFVGSVWLSCPFLMIKREFCTCLTGFSRDTQHLEPGSHKLFEVKYASQYPAKLSATQTPGQA